MLAEHEVVCLIGASGSGKSTLLRCVNLLEPIDSGRIVVGGEEITARGGWGDVVVVHLGTNGSFSEETMTALFDALAGVPRVIVLTVHADRGYTNRNNELIATLPGRYGNVTVIDWNNLVAQCEGNCLYDDGIHLPPAGRR